MYQWILLFCFPKYLILNFFPLFIGGRNGYGAKLCNIFSTKFTVTTACRQYKKKFKQVGIANYHLYNCPECAHVRIISTHGR